MGTSMAHAITLTLSSPLSLPTLRVAASAPVAGLPWPQNITLISGWACNIAVLTGSAFCRSPSSLTSDVSPKVLIVDEPLVHFALFESEHMAIVNGAKAQLDRVRRLAFPV